MSFFVGRKVGIVEVTQRLFDILILRKRNVGGGVLAVRALSNRCMDRQNAKFAYVSSQLAI